MGRKGNWMSKKNLCRIAHLEAEAKTKVEELENAQSDERSRLEGKLQDLRVQQCRDLELRDEQLRAVEKELQERLRTS